MPYRSRRRDPRRCRRDHSRGGGRGGRRRHHPCRRGGQALPAVPACDHRSRGDRPCARYLGPEASIGMGAVLSLGCAIGAGSVVAESALVPQGKSVPPETLVAGIPAKPLRPLTQADRESWQATKDWYVRLTAAYLDPNHFFPVAPREA
ncbi:MAG: gamma carbonic anhydrase family protein [Oscillospiraceae bacterium]